MLIGKLSIYVHFHVSLYPYFQGLLLGWAWGNAAMVAALHSRSPALLAHQTQQFQSSYVFFLSLSRLSSYQIFPDLSRMYQWIYKLRLRSFTGFISTRGLPLLPTRHLQISSFYSLFRSSAVYGAFFFVGTFGLGVIRAYIPNLALLTILATIVLDVVSNHLWSEEIAQ